MCLCITLHYVCGALHSLWYLKLASRHRLSRHQFSTFLCIGCIGIEAAFQFFRICGMLWDRAKDLFIAGWMSLCAFWLVQWRKCCKSLNTHSIKRDFSCAVHWSSIVYFVVYTYGVFSWCFPILPWRDFSFETAGVWVVGRVINRASGHLPPSLGDDESLTQAPSLPHWDCIHNPILWHKTICQLNQKIFVWNWSPVILIVASSKSICMSYRLQWLHTYYGSLVWGDGAPIDNPQTMFRRLSCVAVLQTA